MQSGFLALQMYLPCNNIKWWAFFRWRDGNIFKSCFSTWSGLFPFVSPVLLLTLKTWVSTAIVGFLKASFKTTLAVFLPTPGRSISSSNLFGTLLWYFSNRILDKKYKFLALLLKSPILLIRFLILFIPRSTKCLGV